MLSRRATTARGAGGPGAWHSSALIGNALGPLELATALSGNELSSYDSVVLHSARSNATLGT